jgi:beta,beta-carotene 9',10'-dioxygenase
MAASATATAFLRSNAYLKDSATGRLNYMGFAQDPCRALFRKFMTLFTTPDPGNNAVVNVTRLGNEFIAMTEAPLAVRFDPRTLETLGVLDYDDKVAATLATAHPHFDSARSMGVNLMTEFGLKTKYQLYGITATARRKLAEIVSKDISYMHSFGLTQRYAVIVQFSLRLGSAATVLLSGRPFIENFKFSPRPTRSSPSSSWTLGASWLTSPPMPSLPSTISTPMKTEMRRSSSTLPPTTTPA